MTQEIGKIIKKVREEKDLSLEDVHQLSGVSAATISRLERGEKETSYSNVLRITKALGLKLTLRLETQAEGV